MQSFLLSNVFFNYFSTWVFRGPTSLHACLRTLTDLMDATIHTFHNYAAQLWSDVVADHCEYRATCMLGFLSQKEPKPRHCCGVACRRRKRARRAFLPNPRRGFPIVLLPLALAPSQWEPLVPLLSQHYCTITVGGPFVGSVAALEGRLISGCGTSNAHRSDGLSPELRCLIAVVLSPSALRR